MPTALITGASTGIGRDLAFECARAGYDLIVVARNHQQPETLAEEVRARTEHSVRTIVKDLAEARAAEEIFDELAGTTVEMLINNAGVGMRGMFHELPAQKEMAMLYLNVNTLTLLTRLFLPGMVERRKGWVMNVASTAAFQSGPLMAIYYATRAYVLSLSVALHEEVKEFGVVISALCPGATDTEFSNRAEMAGTKLFQGANRMHSSDVARIGFAGMQAGEAVVIPGARNRVMAFAATRLIPRQMAAKIARALQEKAS